MQFKTTDNTKILLVEDNLVNCEVAIDMLETIGLDVDVANNGRQALDLYDNNHYKLVLMDCEMPVMDGYSATRHIRSRENKLQQSSAHGIAAVRTSIPIIALTAHVMSRTREKCIATGMDDFLGKPFTLSDLKSILTKWLDMEVMSVHIPAYNKADIAQPAGIDDIESDWHIISYDVMKKFYQKQQKDGSNLVSNIINIYIDQSSELLGNLTEAARKKDADAIRLISHTLKSSSENVGALGLAALCRNVEQVSMKGKIDEIVLSQIYQNYSEVDQALKDILSNVNGF